MPKLISWGNSRPSIYKLIFLIPLLLLLLGIVLLFILYNLGKPEIIHFDFPAETIIVPVSINGNPPIDFLFDTGGTSSSIDITLLDTYQLNSDEKAGWTHINSLGFKKYQIKNTLINVIAPQDLEIYQRLFNRKIYGILSGDFINNYVISFDFTKQIMSIRPPHSLESMIFLHGLQKRVQKTDLILINRIPYINAQIDKSPPKMFRVDTGLGNSLFIWDIYAKGNNLLNKNKKQIPWDGSGAMGHNTYVLTRINSFKINQIEIPDIVSAVAQRMPNGQIFYPEVGLIGIITLKRFHLTLDYPHQSIYFEKNHNFDKREEFLKLGILPDLTSVEHGIVIKSVYRGFPAEKDGLKANDVILAINDIPVRSIPNLNGYLYESFVLGLKGTKFKLKIKNKEGIKDISINLFSLL